MVLRLLAAVGVASLLLVATSPASADIYRCKRKDGTHHYTNIREPGRRCQLVVRGSKRSNANTSAKKKRASASTASGARSKDPARYSRYSSLIDEAAQLYQLPHSFIRAVMRVESDFNPEVVSRAGAMGLMQLMPKTARSMGVSDPFNARQNILGGARYLRILANRFKGDLVLTVAAYNAGEGAVEKHNGIPPYKETQRYVRRVLKHYYAYRGGSAP
ncbi:MAG: lytic transglycosylase domain-containing protein [Myxococcales bacterium]|nr:lytic transglycosylase domain-containing protein [Myxococcales bacterium]